MFQARYYKDWAPTEHCWPYKCPRPSDCRKRLPNVQTPETAPRLDKPPTDPATAARCHHYMRDGTLIQEIMFALMHDQDRAWSMSGNFLRVATGHQPRKPGIVMRRYDNQVSLQQRGELDYM